MDSHPDSGPPPSPPRAALCPVKVHHKRHGPRTHTLTYRVNYLLVDVDTLPELDRTLQGFAYNRRGIFSIRDADYGPIERRHPTPAGGPSIRAWLDRSFADHGFDTCGRRYRLLTQPRILGRAFNPISVVYAYDAAGALDGMLYEVHNTFGERHAYVHRVEQHGRALRTHSCEKALYVSPFFDMQGEYRFAASAPGDRLALGITYKAAPAAGAPLQTRLTARMVGPLVPLTGRVLAATLFANPLGGLKVITAIHYEAAKLFMKRIPLTLRQKPPRTTGCPR